MRNQKDSAIMQLVEPAPGTFTTQELERLAVYRAAVAAGFYTDAVEESHQPAETAEVVDAEKRPTASATSEVPGR
jgi:hypothetical protein